MNLRDVGSETSVNDIVQTFNDTVQTNKIINKRLKWFVKQHQVRYTKSDKVLNTLLNDKIFVTPRDFIIKV